MILLASGSPRRAELLRLIGADFAVCGVDLDETPRSAERPADYVERMAVEKAQAGWSRKAAGSSFQGALGADTSVIFAGEILGKPRDQNDHGRMLGKLAGHVHEVISAAALTDGNQTRTRIVVTQVKLRPMTTAEIVAYWATGEPADKAGGYAIQGLGSVFVESIQGSYSSVVGLPLKETAELLAEFGIGYWLSGTAHE